MTNRFIGAGVAIITPFSDGEVDYNSLRNLVDYTIEGGVSYIVGLGSTGEAATISELESRKILDVIIDQSDGRVPIVAGNFGSNNTGALVDKIKEYNFRGISAILSASPFYNKPSQQGIYEHFVAAADASPIPIILYNVPSRTASNLLASTAIRLSNHPKIIGIKEASGDLSQAKDIIRGVDTDNFFVTSGDDILAPAMTQAGGIGVISVLANAFPLEFSNMISHYLNRNISEGRTLEDKLYPYHDCMYSQGNPSGVKTLMEILGLCTSEVRLPLTKVSLDLKRKMIQLVKEQA